MGMYNVEYQTWCLRHCDTTEVTWGTDGILLQGNARKG